ncbi:hypothetical protein [Kocuria sp. LUK]|uniref:hypothetical protein n=1 Tax=Kocuria sp. LUK TaxID=2897828 RepID=UPI0035AF82C5
MIWVSSSAVLAVVCALSLYWVVPRWQRRRTEPPAGHGAAPVDVLPAAGTAPPQDDPARPGAPVSLRRRTTMATNDTSPRRPGGAASARPGHLRVKWDRVGVLLAGCAALLAAAVTAVVAPFSAAVGWAWPVLLLLLGTGCVVALRRLAVREHAAARRARPRRAVAAPAAEDPHAPREDVALFDHEHAVAEEERAQGLRRDQELDLPAEHEQPVAGPAFTVEELRAEALKVARAADGEQRTWEPVPVPRPTYAQAPVVHRPEPEPLQVPERPAARSSTLKDAARAGADDGRSTLDLDDVLRRRRA